MKKLCVLSAMIVLVAGGAAIQAEPNKKTLVVTSSNRATNELLVYSTSGALVQTVPTGGQGGVGANAGGVAASNGTVAVVNFGSQTVSIFDQGAAGFEWRQTISTATPPVSVAFGKDHLYILGTTTVESHRIDGGTIDASADGQIVLLRADGSAAQVGVVGNQLVISEKSGAIELADLRAGAVVGPAVPVQLPAGSDTPLGLVTRGDNGYVTIAHSDEIALVKNGSVVALVATGSGFPTGSGQQAPCWLALTGPYLFSSNSPSHSISRVLAMGHKLVLDVPVAAHTTGTPTDIAADEELLAVIESNAGGMAHLTQFSIDEDGDLMQVTSSAIASRANGVAIVRER